jgi:hypothetical protein
MFQDDTIDRKKASNVIPLGGVTINIYDHENFDQKILAEVNSSADNIPSEKIYLNGSKFISKLKLFSNDNSISDELRSFMSKDVLINEANIVPSFRRRHEHLKFQCFARKTIYVFL